MVIELSLPTTGPTVVITGYPALMILQIKHLLNLLLLRRLHYQVVSNGIQIEETILADNKKLTHWKEDVPVPTKVMVIGVADFAVKHLAG